MKTLCWASLCIFLWMAGNPLFAQTRTFDILTFTPPNGWKVDASGDHLVFTHIDQAARKYCIMAIYGSRSSSVDLPRGFAAEWAAIVEKSFAAGPAPGPTPAVTSGGVRYVEGGAGVRQGSNPIYIHLMTFTAGDRLASVLLIASDQPTLDRYQPEIRAFLGSLRLAMHSPSPSSPAVYQPEALPTHEAPFRPAGIGGVWMGFPPAFTGNQVLNPRWYTFFDDGLVFTDLPRTGLAGFDRNASQTNPYERPYWGTYHYADGSGAITKPGVRVTTNIRADQPGVIRLDSDRFYRCASVDGLRLNGAWTSYANPNDSDLSRHPVGARPVFRFYRDGRFVDEGVFATFLHGYGNDRNDAAGSGVYEIQNFTITFRFSDGRVKQVAITGLLGANPAQRNDILFMARSRFNRTSQ